MSVAPDDEKSVFEAAFALQDPVKRAQYLDETCGSGTRLRRRIESLLSAAEDGGGFMRKQAADSIEVQTGSDDTEVPNQSIGPYKLLQKIGEGGFGVVYMAEQQQPMLRKVALKIIKLGMDTKEVIARFEAERQALALMDHPNIASVLDAGETESGRPFFAMELVRGVPLTEFCDTNKLSGQERLALFIRVCRAIQHAHHKGIIHRDLKPSNVMVTLHDNKPVPKVIDFGVSKALSQQLTEKTLFTRYGQMVGTPVYMSPEQAQMSGLDIDTRSDIYSLGVLLYELLTGTTPLSAERLRDTGYLEIQRLIAEEEAPTPSTRLSTLGDQQATIAMLRSTEPKKLQKFLGGDLDWIAMKALDKERNRRYESASNFADDIERFLNDDEIQARPPSVAYKLRKIVRRHRGPAIAASIVLAVLCLGLIGTSVGLISAQRNAKAARAAQRTADTQRDAAISAEQDAVTAREKAERTAEERRRLLYASNMQLADQLWNSQAGTQRRIQELLAAWIPTNSKPDLREFSWRHQWSRLHQSSKQTVLDAKQIAISQRGNLITASSVGIREWNESDDLIAQHWSGDASNARLSPNGRWALLPSAATAQLIDILSGETVHECVGTWHAFAPNGLFVASWDPDRNLSIFNIATRGESSRRQLPSLPSKSEVTEERFALSPDGKSFMVRGWPRQTWQILAFLDPWEEPVTLNRINAARNCVWSQDGKIMASGGYVGKTYLWAVSNPENKLIFGSHGRDIRTLCFSPDSTKLAMGGDDGSIDIWDVSEVCTALETPRVGKDPGGLGGLPPKEAQARAPLGSDRAPRRPRVYDQTEPREIPRLVRTIKAHLGSVDSLVFSSDGTKLASLDADGTAKLWDLSAEDGRYDLEGLVEDRAGRIGISFEDSDNGVRVADLAANGPAALSGKIEKGDRIVGLSDDTRGDVDLANLDASDVGELAVGAVGSKVRLTIEKRKDGEHVSVELERHRLRDARSFRIAFAPDGDSITIADTQIGATKWTRSGNGMRRYSARGVSTAYSSDGRLLALDNWDKVELWDLKTDELRTILYAGAQQRKLSSQPISHFGSINDGRASMAFSPGGEYLALGTGFPWQTWAIPSDLRVYDLTSLQEIGSPLSMINRGVTSLVFTPDGNSLLVLDFDGVVRIWNTTSWGMERSFSTVGIGARAMSISPDGQTVAIGGRKGVSLWNLASGKPLRVLGGHSVHGFAFSPDGRTLVSVGRDHTALLWDVESGLQLQTYTAHTDVVCGVAFSPDGNTLATAGNDGLLRIWEAASFEEIDRHPLTIKSMVEIGRLRNQQQRYSEAEAMLRRTLRLQEETLSHEHAGLDETRAEIAVALKGQGKYPVITQEPMSTRVALGDKASFHVKVNGTGPWTFQWFFAGNPIEGATESTLANTNVSSDDLGRYHVEVQSNPPDPAVAAVNSADAFLVDDDNPIVKGALRREVFLNISGSSVSDLARSTRFPDEPDVIDTVKSWENPGNFDDHFGIRLSGFVIPPKTGDYVFYLCSDDESQLFLSDNDLPHGKRMIASVSYWRHPRTWQYLPSESISQPVQLQAGKRYWLETLLKDGGTADHLAVTWQLPGDPPPQNGDPPIAGDYLEHRLE